MQPCQPVKHHGFDNLTSENRRVVGPQPHTADAFVRQGQNNLAPNDRNDNADSQQGGDGQQNGPAWNWRQAQRQAARHIEADGNLVKHCQLDCLSACHVEQLAAPADAVADGQGGILVAEGDYPAFASAVDAVCSSATPGAAERSAHARRFSWSVFGVNLISVLAHDLEA
jgi:hypothetical protein